MNPSAYKKFKQPSGYLTAFGSMLKSAGDTILVPLLAVLTAMIVGAVVILLANGNPIAAYFGLILGSLGSLNAISDTLVWSTPYIFAGLAVSIAFKGGLFNIGAEGQLAVGALVSSLVGYGLPSLLGFDLPAPIHILLVVGLGTLGGSLWAMIAGVLKATTGGHEVINTIMLNYIALNIVSFLLNGPMKDPSPMNVTARTPSIAEAARIPRLFEGYTIHWGFILALLAAVFIWWLLWKTALGYEIRTTGANPDAAKYAGIKVGRSIVISMALSGALAGLAGSVEVSALNYRYELGFSSGYGFDAIAIALLGKTHPAGVVLAALLFGAMRAGATQMQFLTQIPVDVISVIQAMILLFVAADTIVRWLYRIKVVGEKVVLTRGWGG